MSSINRYQVRLVDGTTAVVSGVGVAVVGENTVVLSKPWNGEDLHLSASFRTDSIVGWVIA